MHLNETIAQARAAATQAPAVTRIDWGHAVKGTKALISFFKSADSAWDEWARKGPDGKQGNLWQVKGFDSKTEGRFLSTISSITRTVFRLGMGNSGDKLLVAQLGAMLYPKVGDLAEKLRMDELMRRIDPEFPFAYEERATPEKGGKEAVKQRGPKPANLAPDSPAGTARNLDPEAARAMAVKAREGVQQTLDDALNNPKNSNFHQIRLGTVIAGLEAINLVMQVEHLSEKGEVSFDDRLKVIGASLALLASAYDMAYIGAKVIREQADWLVASQSVSGPASRSIRGAGEYTRGGLKLTAGLMSFGAGLIGAYFDEEGTRGAYQKNEYSLVIILGARSLTGFFGAFYSLAAAYSYSGLFLTRLAIKHTGSRILSGALLSLGTQAAKWGARVRLLTIVARFNLAGLVLTGVEIGYRVFFMDNEMEKWCKHCTFRKDKDLAAFDSMEKELEVLEQTFMERDY